MESVLSSILRYITYAINDLQLERSEAGGLGACPHEKKKPGKLERSDNITDTMLEM